MAVLSNRVFVHQISFKAASLNMLTSAGRLCEFLNTDSNNMVGVQSVKSDISVD
jgi:hypothetical protein